MNTEGKGKKNRLPNKTIGAAANGSDWRNVLGGDFEEVSEDVVLNEFSSMDGNSLQLGTQTIGFIFLLHFPFSFLCLKIWFCFYELEKKSGRRESEERVLGVIECGRPFAGPLMGAVFSF